MKVSITREQYEELKKRPNPYVRLDMECKYFMEVLVEPVKARKPSKKSAGARSPFTKYGLSERADKIVLRGHKFRRARAYATELSYPMAGGEIGEKMAAALGLSRSNASHTVTRLIRAKVLVEA